MYKTMHVAIYPHLSFNTTENSTTIVNHISTNYMTYTNLHQDTLSVHVQNGNFY